MDFYTCENQIVIEEKNTMPIMYEGLAKLPTLSLAGDIWIIDGSRDMLFNQDKANKPSISPIFCAFM